MTRASIGIGCGILTATLLLAGLAAAGPLGVLTGDGGGSAEGEAHGAYYVDATGALSAAADANADAHDQLVGQWQDSNALYETTREDLWNKVASTEAPEMPDCACDEIFDQLDQAGSMELAHTDSIEKALDLETGYVDAGADLGATGSVKAWFTDLFTGAKDAFHGIKDMLVVDTTAVGDVKGEVYTLLHTDDDIRSQVGALIEEEHELPAVDPSVDGSFAAEHAMEVAASAVGDIQATVP